MSADISAYEGWFSFESLNVRLGFTRAAHEAAFAEMVRTGRQPEEMRTYIHELTHFVQATTTPYGLFVHYCRQLQTADTITMLRALLAADARVARPLLRNDRLTDAGTVDPTVRGALLRWVSTEVLVAFLGQNSTKLVHYLDRLTGDGAKLPYVSPLQTLRRLQGGIAQLIEDENSLRGRPGDVPWDNGAFDVAALNAEGDDLGDDFSRRLERSALVLELFGYPWGTESILESAATAAEWAESGAELAALRAYAADNADPDLAMYKNCLARGLDAISADDLPQFAFSFIALCELALYPPLLPQHAALRGKVLDPRQLFPAFRFQMLLGAVEHVRPLQGLADVGRFHVELCRALEWVHPIQLIVSASSGPQIVADRRAQRYIWAQAERARMQHAFTNLLRRAVDPSPRGAQFRDRYAFPVIEYADRTLYMGDKDALWSLTTQHLLTMTMRQIMLGSTLVIACPYRGAPAEAETLTQWLRDSLEALFGRQFPMARVAARE